MLRVGVIGYKNHADRIIGIVRRSELAEVTAIFHPEKELGLKNATRRIEDLLTCDAVMVLSPNHTHFEYLSYFGRNFDGYIFCEKPPVTTSEELDRLELDPRRTFFNFNYRFSRLRKTIGEAIEDGSLGNPIHMFVCLTQGLAFKKHYASSWRADAALHKHGITETKGIHYIDLANDLFGDVSRHVYVPSNISGNGTAYDTCHLTLYYESGAVATLLLSYAAPLTNHLQVIGTNGVVEYRDRTIRVLSPRDTFDERGLFTDPACKNSYGYTEAGTDMYMESLERSVAFFLEHCREKRDFPESMFVASLNTNRFILDNLSRDALSSANG